MTRSVPPGFRFHPTDEELLDYYLRKKMASESFDLDVMKEVDLNKLEPWDLNEKCRIGSAEQSEWYFFSHKDKKYPSGTRTNRATGAGFWKATGRDKAVASNYKRIGMRKTLVFYRGRAPRGQKTEWIMHEYRLEDEDTISNEEGWVVCRVFKKRNHVTPKYESSSLDHQQQSRAASASSQKLERPSEPPTLEDANQQQPICKKEVEDYNLTLLTPTNSSYLQLPQLESPKLTTTSSTAEDMGGYFAAESNFNIKTIDPFSPLYLAPNEACCSSRQFFGSESSIEDLNQASLLTEWNLLESLAKESRFTSSFIHIPNELQAASRQLPFEYVSLCDLDLWSFPKY